DMYNAGPNIPFSFQLNTPTPVELDNPHIVLASGTTGTLTINPASLTGLDRTNYKQPASYQWSLGVQRSLGAKTVLSVAYVGNTNRFQNYYTEYNLPSESYLGALIGGANYNTAPGLPYPGYHSIRQSVNEANSHYN